MNFQIVFDTCSLKSENFERTSFSIFIENDPINSLQFCEDMQMAFRPSKVAVNQLYFCCTEFLETTRNTKGYNHARYGFNYHLGLCSTSL